MSESSFADLIRRVASGASSTPTPERKPYEELPRDPVTPEDTEALMNSIAARGPSVQRIGSGTIDTVMPKTVVETAPNIDYSTEAGIAQGLTNYGITDVAEQAGVIAQLKAESNLKPRSESLKYSPERLMEVFPRKFKNLYDARQVVAKGEEAIGNRIYGGRMGNSDNEGFKYRGRGFIQLTGKDNYKKYGNKIGVDLVENPDLANEPEVALKIAVEYLKERSKDLTSAYENTKAVAPAGWRKKVEPRQLLQNEAAVRLEEILKGIG